MVKGFRMDEYVCLNCGETTNVQQEYINQCPHCSSSNFKDIDAVSVNEWIEVIRSKFNKSKQEVVE